MCSRFVKGGPDIISWFLITAITMTQQNGVPYFPDYDLIVIGSGPAGCAAAINARRLGLSVLMITKQANNQQVDADHPSESLHPGVLTLLHHIGAASILDKATVGKYTGIKREGEIDYFPVNTGETSAGYHVNKSIFNK